MNAGVLALQGAYRPHRERLAALGAAVREVRSPGDLERLDALVLPGGESTTVSFLLDSSGLRQPLGAAVAGGLPTLATCAGVIVLAREVRDGRPDQQPLGALDVVVRRNAYGRQVDSFEAELDVEGLDGFERGAPPFAAVFIRAPVIEEVGPGVEVLARVDGSPVLVRQGGVLAATFHPELSDDGRIHAAFLALAAGTGTGAPRPATG